MGVCIFVASGVDFDVDDYLPGSPFKPAGVFHKGEIPKKSNPRSLPRDDSGFTVLVSETPDPGLSRQTEQCLAFLIQHERVLVALKKAGADNMLMHFGTQATDDVEQFTYLPPTLLLAMARFSMGLVFSSVRIPQGQ